MADFLYSPHFFWLVCAAFYVFDHFHLHPADEIVLGQSGRGRWSPVLVLSGLRFGRYRVSLLNPLKPWAPTARMRWGLPQAFSTTALTRARRLSRLHVARTRPESGICLLQCGALFGAGPALTEAFGISVAILAVAPLHLACAVAFSILLLRHPTWRAPRSERVKLALQLALCPGFLANGYRRACLLAPLEADGIAFAMLSGDGSDDVLTSVRDFLDDNGGAADVATMREYMSHLGELESGGQRA